MRVIEGTRLELVRCGSCGRVQILSGRCCAACGGLVVELDASGDEGLVKQ